MPDPRQKARGRPKAKVSVPTTSTIRAPKVAADLVVGSDINHGGSRPCWNYEHLDTHHQGSWDWSLSPAEVAVYLAFIKEMQHLTWTEIRAQTSNGHKKHHNMPTESLCAEAKNRLHELRLGEQEELFRFRLQGAVRLWGAFIGVSHEFHVIWWDRDHQVYPLE